ncbi:MAG: GH3 auxin-responsive promoter family protein [Anaerolineales bacterium]|nr:GH3 auxin-responsive promoter family protein [Anaerolineales bacterium]
MTESYKMLREGRKQELWNKHCGYVTLKPKDFLEIQTRLLQEQLKLIGASQLGQTIIGEHPPQTVEEFRQTVPFTTYSDYEDLLAERNEEILPVKPHVWARTSGRTSDKGPKWVPYPKLMYERLGDAVVGAMLMASCSFPGDVRLERNDKLLLATAPPPYTSGYISRACEEQLEVQFLPPIEEGEKMDYGTRLAAGFQLAMRHGLDYFMGLASVLARMGEQFESTSGSTTKPSKDLLNPRVLWRLLRALIITKIQNRNLLPKDIWKLKGIMSGGTDTNIYRDKIEYYWGFKPLEGYATTEFGNLAMQSWNFRGMTFFPDAAFFEFIPIEEHRRNKEEPNYIPRTVLYTDLEPGIYEIVLTSFHGGVFLRYRIGDFFEVISIGDDEINSSLPQLSFYSRVTDIIDIGNIARFTERDIWKALENANLPYTDWIVRKEHLNAHPQLHIYIEPKADAAIDSVEAKQKIDNHLGNLVAEYEDLKTMFDYDPLVVSLLPEGAFQTYMAAQVAAGADLAHIKPPHMQPSDQVMSRLKEVKD